MAQHTCGCEIVCSMHASGATMFNLLTKQVTDSRRVLAAIEGETAGPCEGDQAGESPDKP